MEKPHTYDEVKALVQFKKYLGFNPNNPESFKEMQKVSSLKICSLLPWKTRAIVKTKQLTLYGRGRGGLQSSPTF